MIGAEWHEIGIAVVRDRARCQLAPGLIHLVDAAITPTDAKLTWNNVARSQGSARPTADRASDSYGMTFRRQLDRAKGRQLIPPGIGPRQGTEVDEELATLRRERAELKRPTKVLHAVVLALMSENQQLARRHGQRTNAEVAGLTAADES